MIYFNQWWVVFPARRAKQFLRCWSTFFKRNCTQVYLFWLRKSRTCWNLNIWIWDDKSATRRVTPSWLELIVITLIGSHWILHVWTFGAFFSAPLPLAQCIATWFDSEYELITGVEWPNQNTKNAIFGVENLIMITIIIFTVS